MLMEVYYEHYKEKWRGAKYRSDKKFIPYAVLFPSNEMMRRFMDILRRDGLKCVASNLSYRGLLVNLDLKRFGVIEKACRHSCVDDRKYTPEEFV